MIMINRQGEGQGSTSEGKSAINNNSRKYHSGLFSVTVFEDGNIYRGIQTPR